MDDSWSQLNAFAAHGDQTAFAKVVEAHLGLVYSAAYRTLGNASAAEEVTQSVFILLAEKAPQLKPEGALSVWLYRAACLQAKKHRHRELTRSQRESHIREMNDTFADDPDNDLDWKHVAPLLDEAMEALSEDDRTAIVLRYFQKRPLREIGQSLGVSEEAARKRVARSLEKLRQWFAHRGVACSAIALGSAIAAHSVQAVPQTLSVASIQSAVINASASATSSTTTSIYTVMASTKGFFVSALVLGAMVPISMSVWER
ncbi:MAG: sigma-70 family RNA polymerase sigma factor, partial [Verrucomicrobiae bacterium]|nr:sigma-70 family RNA polymerase sigma factor [Verrucomicrobiae bacterium]